MWWKNLREWIWSRRNRVGGVNRRRRGKESRARVRQQKNRRRPMRRRTDRRTEAKGKKDRWNTCARSVTNRVSRYVDVLV